MSKPAVAALLHRQPQRLTAWLWRLMECLEGTAPAAWVARQSPQTANEPRADCLKIGQTSKLSNRMFSSVEVDPSCISRPIILVPRIPKCNPNATYLFYSWKKSIAIPTYSQQLKGVFWVLKSKILKHKAPNRTMYVIWPGPGAPGAPDAPESG